MTKLLIVDFEATCDDAGKVARHEMEIIECGAVLLDHEGRVLDQFQALVQPVRNPELTDFCTELTGITQAQVDAAKPFPAVAKTLADWISPHREGLTWGSWGRYDANQLAQDCAFHGADDPLDAPHINLKSVFSKVSGHRKQVGVKRALSMCGLTFEGDHHRGLDDAKNIARIVTTHPKMLEALSARAERLHAERETPPSDQDPGFSPS